MQRYSKPSGILSSWIAYFWSWKYPLGTSIPTLFPGTGGELLFNLGDPLQIITIPIYTDCSGTPLVIPKGEAVLLCPRKSRMVFTASGEIDIISVRLRSATCFPFLGISLDELGDAPRLFTELNFRCDVPELFNLAYELRVSRLKHWLYPLLSRCYSIDPAIIWGVNRLYYGDDPSVIRTFWGCSERTMLRKITQFTGVDTRYFCRTSRFQRALRQLLAEGNILDSTFGYDYFDQSHFIKTCRLYTDLTPTQLLDLQYRKLNHYSFNNQSGFRPF